MEHNKIQLIIVNKIALSSQKYYIYLSLISIFLFLGLSVLGGYSGHYIKFLVAALVYCIFSFAILSRISTRKVRIISLLIIILPPTLIHIPIHLIDIQETRLSLPSSLAHFIGFGFGIIIYASKLYFKIIFGTILLAIAIWMSVAGYSLWLHKLSFGTYSGQVYYKITTPIEGIDQLGKYITSQELKDKTIVLDFWHTHCGVCFKKFPQFQELYDEYRNNPSLYFLAINKPQKRDTIDQAFNMIMEREYTFPTIIPVDEELPDKFGVKYYPTTIIINEDGYVVFFGSIEKAENVIRGLIKNGM